MKFFLVPEKFINMKILWLITDIHYNLNILTIQKGKDENIKNLVWTPDFS